MLNNGHTLQQRYKIVKILGHGGMGAVYLSEDQRLPTKWAIKEMKRAGLSEEEHQEAVEFFHSEARLLSELRHRNLPRIVDFFEQEDQLYLVMDYVEGETLESRIQKDGPLAVNFALELCLQVSDVLDYLHTRPSPVVFRDFKPANVMLTPQDEVKLIDFGIARVFKKDANADTKALGTPGYAAPEQYGRGQSSPRTDLFAFGATMHHALTGRDPTHEPFAFPPITDFRQDLPAEFVAMLEQCLSLKAAERPESAFAVKRVLEELLGRTGSSALASRPTTTRLKTEEETTEQDEPAAVPAAAPPSPIPASPSLPQLPVVSFSPKALLVKQLDHGEKATLRLKIKSDRSVSLIPNSPHIQVYPDKIGPGSTTATVTVDSAELVQGSTFTGAIEVDDIDELALPIEARISTPKASTMTLVGMFTLCVLTLIPVFNYATTVMAGIIMFSTPKAKRASLKIPWRLNLLFTFAWTGFFVAVGFGLSQVDWQSVRQWGESFFA